MVTDLILQTFYAPVSVVTDHICGVMVNMLVSSAVDHEFEHRCGQAKNYKTGIFFFIAKHTALRSKGTNCLALDQDYVS